MRSWILLLNVIEILSLRYFLSISYLNIITTIYIFHDFIFFFSPFLDYHVAGGLSITSLRRVSQRLLKFKSTFLCFLGRDLFCRNLLLTVVSSSDTVILEFELSKHGFQQEF